MFNHYLNKFSEMFDVMEVVTYKYKYGGPIKMPLRS